MTIKVGDRSPKWTAVAHVDGKQETIRSADYEGKWHIIYWYPLDFTAVCPTEIHEFQALLSDFKAEEVDVIGASTDSFFSHAAWFSDRDTFSAPITHPIIADTSHAFTKLFGVLKDDLGVGFRAIVIVDDQGIVRSMSVNDLAVARSPEEVLRTVQAFQSGGNCGVGWKKGAAFAA